MPTRTADVPRLVHLSGDEARRLAHRLLAPEATGDLDRLWPEIAPRSASRVAHDWDPATERLVIASRFASSA